MSLRSFFLILILSSQAACTLYQSEGREALEKNKAGIVVFQAVNVSNQLAIKCIQDLEEPREVKGPLEVIDQEYEELGFSSYLIETPENKRLLVYQDPEAALSGTHHYCFLNSTAPWTESKLTTGISWAVQVLIEQKRLDQSP